MIIPKFDDSSGQSLPDGGKILLYHATITSFNSSELPIFNNLLQLKFFVMPIRMTDDPVDPNQQDDDGGGGRRPTFPGGGGVVV